MIRLVYMDQIERLPDPIESKKFIRLPPLYYTSSILNMFEARPNLIDQYELERQEILNATSLQDNFLLS